MPGFYSTRAWREARDAILCSAPLCRACQDKGILTPATEVDHITPISKGGAPLDWDNLQPLCKPCHSSKTAVDAGRAKAKGCDANGVPLDPAHHWR